MSLQEKNVVVAGHEALSDASSAVVIQKDVEKKWTTYLWDTLDKSPKERRFLFKLDAAILTFASLGYFIKYLDQSNVNNAFVSGMKEDLNLNGNQLNYMTTAWTVGYVIGEIPSNMVLTRVRPSIWIPACELVWTILTMCLSKCNTATQVYALRFFVGLAESAFYPGMQYVIGSWYRRDELAKRSCIFHTSSALGTMFSGYLMTAVYHLGGKGGLKGWQWLFIVDGVISLPVAIAGFFCLPDVPETTRAWYLSDEEKDFARKRMQLEGRENRQPYSKAKFKKIFSSWHIYWLSALYVFFNVGNAGSTPVFAQYLKDSKSPKYSISQINTYPTGTNAVQVVSTLAYAWISDSLLNGRRWPPIVFGAIVNLIVYISLSIWDIGEGWRWTCFYLMGCGFGLSGLCMAYADTSNTLPLSPLCHSPFSSSPRNAPADKNASSWAHEICSEDNEERALVIASMNEMAYVFQAWLPLIVWQQTDAPQYQKGYITVTVLAFLLIVTAFTIRFLWKRELIRKERDAREASVDVTSGDGSGIENERVS